MAGWLTLEVSQKFGVSEVRKMLNKCSENEIKSIDSIEISLVNFGFNYKTFQKEKKKRIGIFTQ